ncbi:hypothetical protein OpiT1DRAFT_03582 [Opitutaceae bacterium TAV1]|nr:hypothetical protein OpiT1DRAFT_03582 [Opitutaceae bacterium TAV1]
MNHAFSSVPAVSLFAAGLLLSVAPLPGETIQQTRTAASGESWVTPGLWNNTAAASSGNDYYTNGWTLRTPDGPSLSVAFPGASLTVDGGAGGERGMLSLKAGTTEIADLRLGVGTVSDGVAGGNPTTNRPATLNITNLTLLSAATSATAAIFRGPYDGNDITLNVTNLLGSGYLQFVKGSDAGKRIFTLAVSNASSFTGTLELQHGTLDLASTINLTSGSFIMATTNTTLRLNSSLTVSSFTFGSFNLEAGSYTSSELNSRFSTSAFAGAGQLTIQAIPEASAFAWMLGGITLIACAGFRCVRRR